MKLFNTLTRQKETLEPIKPPIVTVYTCGPTVYLEPQIGNWRAFLFYDTLVRTLKASKYEVKHVLNITDVGHLVSDGDEGADKVAKTAERLHKTAWQVADFYTELFLGEMKLLNLRMPNELPRATQHIKEQVILAEILEKKGYAYRTPKGLYFDTSKVKDYGKLAGSQIAGNKPGARVEVDKEKRRPLDFALWKLSPKSQKRDMEWESPWGVGFPGWHLECSAIALEYLGKTIDIHAGGVDHIGTHHTNEIAQSEAATGQPFAHIWLHNEFLLSEGKKMAKSIGNYFTLTDIVKKGFNPLTFRLLVLQAHYRKRINFSWKALTAAQTNLQAIYALADRQFQTQSILHEASDANLIELLHKSKQAMLRACQNDLNTPKALTHLQKVVDYVAAHPVGASDKNELLRFLRLTDRLFGLRLRNRQEISEEQRQVINERNKARKHGEFDQADQLRDQLKSEGIILDDTPFGTIWYRSLNL